MQFVGQPQIPQKCKYQKGAGVAYLCFIVRKCAVLLDVRVDVRHDVVQHERAQVNGPVRCLLFVALLVFTFFRCLFQLLLLFVLLCKPVSVLRGLAALAHRRVTVLLWHGAHSAWAHGGEQMPETSVFQFNEETRTRQASNIHGGQKRMLLLLLVVSW